MIGSVIFYGLYPLTWFINRVSGKSQTGTTDMTIKRAEPSRKAPSTAFSNGKEACDSGGRGVQARRFTKTQTALLDQWLSAAGGTPRAKRETEEGLKEGAPGKEETNEAAVSAAEPEEAAVEPASERSEPQGATEEEEAEVSDEVLVEQVREEAGPPEDQEASLRSDAELKREEVKVTTLVSIDESKSGGPTKELLSNTDDVQSPSVVDGGVEADASEDGEIRRLRQPAEGVDVEASVTVTKTQELGDETRIKETSSVVEYWEDYQFGDTGGQPLGICGPPMDLVSLLSEVQTETWESKNKPQQTGWHFPAGPGLGEVVYRPMWQFPGMSYYPTLQENAPFEVAWRVWEDVGVQTACPDPNAVFDFTVMSYNILAQDLLEANQELYVHCPLEVLAWDYRLRNLIQEFQKWEPDILCLQEVQESHYKQHLQPALKDMGYTCVYKRRTGTKTDGCALCYRGDRFSQLSVSLLEFFRPGCGLLDRDNVGVVLLLQPIVSRGSEFSARGPPLCVANTHLLFNPRRGDVKLAQAAIVLAEIDRLVKSCRIVGDHCNVVLCGDFNCLPNMALYQLITTGQLNYYGLPAWMVSGQEDMSYKVHPYRLPAPLWPGSLGITDNCQFTTDQERQEQPRQKPGKLWYNHDFLLRLRFCEPACVRPRDLETIPGVTDNTPDPEGTQPCAPRFRRTICHGLDLQSVYRHYIPDSDRSEVTTLHSDIGATVDYIFYTAGSGSCGDDGGGGQLPGGGLKLMSRLSLLSEEDLWSMKGLPNEVFPSDHLSLLARFELELSPL